MDAAGNSYGPYDLAVNPAAEPFTEAAWYRVNRRSGVHRGGALTFDGRQARLAAILLEVQGSWLSRDDVWTDTAPATAAGSNPRRDLLVARRQLTSGEGTDATPGKTFLTVLRGNPAVVPATPTPDYTTDEPLWSWQMPGNGGSTVTNLIDHRRATDDVLWVPSMAARPAERIWGTRLRPRDAPGLSFTCDGRVWAQDGIHAPNVVAGAPAGSYVRRVEDTIVTTVGNNSGAFNILIAEGFGFSALPLLSTMAPGDTAGEPAFIRPYPQNHTPSTLHGQAFNADGFPLPSGSVIRVNYTTYGYNQ